MKHALSMANLVIFAATVFFLVLTVFFASEPTGKATTGTQVNIVNSTPVNCSAQARVGLNTLSFPCISTATAIAEVLNGSGVYAVYQYTPGGDLWKVHNPNLPSYVVSDLQFLSRRAGYVVLMNQSQDINLSGLLVQQTGIPIIAGWNLVGYPTLTELNATESFAIINDSFTIALTYNNTGGYYRVYYNPPTNGTLNTTKPGEGYWINGTQSDTWTVDG